MNVFKRKSIAFATFIGGPITAGLMLYHNFKQFDRSDFARNTLLCSIGFTGILFAVIIQLPETIGDRIPNHLLPFVYLGITDLIYYKFLRKQVDAHIASGGAKASPWLAVRNTAIGMVSIVALVVLMAAFAAPFEGEKFAYGPTEHEIYHDAGVTTMELNEVGRALTDFGYFGTSEKQVVQLVTENDVYVLRLYVDRGWWDDPDVLESLATLKSNMLSYNISKPVRVKMIADSYSGTEEKEI